MNYALIIKNCLITKRHWGGSISITYNKKLVLIVHRTADKFKMSRIAIFTLLIAFALLLLLSTLAAEVIDSYKQSCEDYLSNELAYECDSKYKDAKVVSRRKRSFRQKYKELVNCCFNPCDAATLRSHCGVSYDPNRLLYFDVDEVSLRL